MVMMRERECVCVCVCVLVEEGGARADRRWVGRRCRIRLMARRQVLVRHIVVVGGKGADADDDDAGGKTGKEDDGDYHADSEMMGVVVYRGPEEEDKGGSEPSCDE